MKCVSLWLWCTAYMHFSCGTEGLFSCNSKGNPKENILQMFTYVLIKPIYASIKVFCIQQKAWNWKQNNHCRFDCYTPTFFRVSTIVRVISFNRESCSGWLWGWYANHTHDRRVLLVTIWSCGGNIFFAVEVAPTATDGGTMVLIQKLSLISYQDTNCLLDSYDVCTFSLFLSLRFDLI